MITQKLDVCFFISDDLALSEQVTISRKFKDTVVKPILKVSRVSLLFYPSVICKFRESVVIHDTEYRY